IDVDVVGLQPLEARLAGLRDIFGAAVDTVLAARVLGLAKFRSEHDLIAASFERTAEQLLVLTPAIHVGTVGEIGAKIDRLLDEALAGGIVARPVNPAERHAAKTDRGGLRPVPAYRALLQSHPSFLLISGHHSGKSRNPCFNCPRGGSMGSGLR